ncbi:hypothetical protein C0993_009655 [Termitomyces sp. T159_Od127]|nr:hypothetical protein C0993_009655 [Termitomyces sp. T159_Od127]
MVSPVVGTPELGSDKDDKDEVRRLGVAIEASKAALGTEDLVGPSCQAEAAQDVGASLEGTDQEETEEEGEVRPEVTPQAQPWGHGSPQWSWLPEWGATHPITREVSSSDKPESWVPRCRIRARSVETLRDYQGDVTQALEWQEENNIQEGDLLPLRDSSLPSDDD